MIDSKEAASPATSWMSRRGLLSASAAGAIGTAMAVSPGAATTAAAAAPTSTATDFPGVDPTGRTDSTKGLQAWLDSGAREGVLPQGTYKISSTLKQRGMHVRLDRSAEIVAGSAINGPLWTTDPDITEGARMWDYSLSGGIFNGNGGLAKGGVRLYLFSRFQFTDSLIRDVTEYGVMVGDTTAPHESCEAIISNVNMNIWAPTPFSATSKGLWINNASDNEITAMIIHGFGIGVYSDKPSTNFSNIHVWGDEGRVPVSCFVDNKTGNTWTACTADGPSSVGFQLNTDQTRMVGCRVFQPSYHSLADQQITGIRVAWAGARHTIVGCLFQGYSTTRRLKADIDGAGIANGLLGNGSAYVGNVSVNVAQVKLPTIAGDTATMSRVDAGQITAKSLIVNKGHSSAADAPFQIKTAEGKVQVLARTDYPRMELVNGTMLMAWRGNYAAETVRIDGDAGAVRFGTPAGLGGAAYSGSGAPTLAGKRGDLYINTAGGIGSWLYRCTSDGVNWTAML